MKTKREIWFSACARQVTELRRVRHLIEQKMRRKKDNSPKVPFTLRELKGKEEILIRNICTLAALLDAIFYIRKS